MKIPLLLSPLRRGSFRLLWAGMGASYAGDRLQELAQAWLVATLTGSSALAVGWVSILASLPQMLMPLGGIVLDRFGVTRLIGGAAVPGIFAVGVLFKVHRPVEP